MFLLAQTRHLYSCTYPCARKLFCSTRYSVNPFLHLSFVTSSNPMSTTQQAQINAVTQQKLELVLEAIQRLNEDCALLSATHDEHDERIERLESNASVRAHDNRNNTSATTRPSQACPLDASMENTIRLTCHKELADLVVKLCKHDEDTQKLAVSLLLEGEGNMCAFTSYNPHHGSAGPSRRRKRRRTEEALYSDDEY